MTNLHEIESGVISGALSGEEIVLKESYVDGIEEHKLDPYLFLGSLIHDRENDILIGSDGAVAGIYYLDKDESEDEINRCLAKLQEKHPNYVLKLKEDKLPILVGNGPESLSMVYSTHVIYITNYEEFIKKSNSKEGVKSKKIGSLFNRKK